MIRKKKIIVITILLIMASLLSSAFAQGGIATIKYTSQGLRDPLKNILREDKISPALDSLKEEKEEVISLPALHVQGMVWGADPVKAIINNQVVGKGDIILEAEILDIKKDGVYLLYKGKEFVVRTQ